MRRSLKSWPMICLLCCVATHPLDHQDTRLPRSGSSLMRSNSRLRDLDILGSSVGTLEYPSKDRYADLMGTRDEESGSESFEDVQVAPKPTTSSRYEMLPMPRKAEPDAEMLPVHYTGVKPPGVDHMEMRYLDPDTEGTQQKVVIKKIDGGIEIETGGSETAEEEKGMEVSSKDDGSHGFKEERGFKKGAVFEKGFRDERGKENRKGEYQELAGKRKKHDDIGFHYKGSDDEDRGEEDASFQLEEARKKGHNAAGYRNVYHKDEYKKDADFYNKGHKGGDFQKHGRYDEKHAAMERAFKKEANQDLGTEEVVAAKEGSFEAGHDLKDSKGQDGKKGYDEFHEKNEETGNKSGRISVGKKLAFGKGQILKAR